MKVISDFDIKVEASLDNGEKNWSETWFKLLHNESFAEK